MVARAARAGRARPLGVARWTYEWDAAPGEHVLACRARDAAGNEQPLEPTWNVGGYANNAVQRVPVGVVATGAVSEGCEKVAELAADAVELVRLRLQLALFELGLRVLERLDLRLVLLRANLHLALLRLDGRRLRGRRSATAFASSASAATASSSESSMSDLACAAFLTGSFVTAASGSSRRHRRRRRLVAASSAAASVSVPLVAFSFGVVLDGRVGSRMLSSSDCAELAATPEEIAPKAGVKCRLGNHDHHRLLSDQLAQCAEPLLGRLGDCDDDAPVLDAGRQRLEALRVLTRELGERIGVEPDRGPLDVVEAPLLGEQAGDIVLGGEAAANHDLAETLAGATAFVERIVELHLREEPGLDQKLTERDANGSSAYRLRPRPSDSLAHPPLLRSLTQPAAHFSADRGQT